MRRRFLSFQFQALILLVEEIGLKFPPSQPLNEQVEIYAYLLLSVHNASFMGSTTGGLKTQASILTSKSFSSFARAMASMIVGT